MASTHMDWQIGLRHIKDRAKHVLESGQWSDCIFVVGTENSLVKQETIPAHRLILAMASPVFEAMFFGSMADKEDKPIEILDVQPQAFISLLKYIYGDEIIFNSIDNACEICYAAKKYMIPPLVEECTKYIWKDLKPQNVCRAYAFVRLFEEPQLLEKCMTMIKTLTEDVVRDASFEEVDISTLKSIMSEETLYISEIELWDGVVRWSEQECGRQSLEASHSNKRKVMQDLLPLFRFLTLSPTQFANGPALSLILLQEECFGLLMNISSPGVVPIPASFCTSTTPRKPPTPPQRPSQMWRGYMDADLEDEQEHLTCACAGPLADIFVNEQLVDCSLSFSVDRDVKIVGVVLPTQLRPQGSPPDMSGEPIFMGRTPRLSHGIPGLLNKYPELIYAFLQDENGSRLTYTHFSARVCWESTMEVLFNRPIYIGPNVTYKIVVVLNKMGRYPLYSTLSPVTVNDVNFSLGDNNFRVSVVKALIFRNTKRLPAAPSLSPHWGILEM